MHRKCLRWGALAVMACVAYLCVPSTGADLQVTRQGTISITVVVPEKPTVLAPVVRAPVQQHTVPATPQQQGQDSSVKPPASVVEAPTPVAEPPAPAPVVVPPPTTTDQTDPSTATETSSTNPSAQEGTNDAPTDPASAP